MDYSRVFAHTSYFVSNFFMKLNKWSMFFDIVVESPCIPIWATSFLSINSSRFGLHVWSPLKTDNATSIEICPPVAHVLVELDVSKQYPNSI
ncbi:hypothetical protein IEQ34_016262 [Dendrobium chrysotoxum]|uniref:Uncharacterized protein n=1 Tax=Dendrobium chrysotoxum TaxID=161865 RepID=A0AAV7GG04_DENCH|nr:hypothetical protein IEQ34_016262 [Dendrobium chrysotoxum]